MVTYIKSDLEFILKQIKISEDHALYVESNGAAGKPLFGGPNASIPSYNISWGLRTVDGSYNHLLPGQEQWGAADNEFLELLAPQFRTLMVDPDGPGGSPAIPITYTPGADADGPGTFAGPGDVIDPEVRTISNLIVDQTLSNPAAIMAVLARNDIPGDHLVIAAGIKAAYEPLKLLFKAVDDATDAAAEARAAANAAGAPEGSPLDQAADAAEAALAAAQLALSDARALDADGAGAGLSFDALLAANGIELSGANVVLTNIAPDEGLSASFNSWFTLFGQFFDHGLDLVGKGGSGTVMIPLSPDDPLYSTEPGALNFMVLTRATVTTPGADGVLGDDPSTTEVDEGADDVHGAHRPINTTTAYVDQNQTYTSHASHQVFVREYALNGANRPVATGNLIEGANGGMATWGEVKAQALMLGIQLTDQDVGNVPLLRTDAYGNFIPDADGYAQVITGIGVDLVPNTDDDVVISGTPGAPVTLEMAVRTGHAFLADIAHNAVPDGLADGDIEIGLDNGDGSQTDGNYDNELLDAHFIAGDGRVNENIGLTAVHHVFHAEHNRLVEHTKATVLASGDAAFIAEWQLPDGSWDGERLFQAAKFGTEMQYQHLVFEEFARKVQPTINGFLVPDGFDTTMNPSIVAEFAHVVYRFGHSMLTESIDRFDPNFVESDISLIEGFLNPTAFNGANGEILDGVAAGAIIRGMTRQAGNEIDEFVTSALRNNLLGLPLDLATINLARGRDTGVPPLNAVRADFYEASNQNILLKPYESWVDFAGHLKNEASIINFIASYGTHALITDQTTIEGKRDAALTLITGVATGSIVIADPPAFEADRLDFLNAAGIYAGGTLGGLNNVDLWIGGLAEEIMPFGGMLGSTFNFVFEVQMEQLQSGDRFYYLQRLDGLHLFGEMENNSFAAMIMRNTNATHLPADVFSTPGLILEVDQTRQYNDLDGDGDMEQTDPDGGGLLTVDVVRNNPGTAGPDTNYLRYQGDEHVVMGGTEDADIIIAGIGDDSLFGDGGNDRLDGGFGNDVLNGGDGDDIIVDAGGDDNIKAGSGNDVVHAGPGLDLVMGGAGQDFIFLGTDEGSEVFAGEGDDFIYGNRNAERILGNEGSDWIETGTFDGAPGDNFDEVFAHDGIDGHDVFLGDGGFDEFIGEGGHDIMVGSTNRGKMVGMSGFDWATYKDSAVGTTGVNADLSIPIIFDEAPTIPANAALDEYQSMEGLSGSSGNDTLRGSNILAEERLPYNALTNPTPLEGYRGSALDAAGIALINGLQAVLGAGVTAYSAGDIILGGDGSDVMAGQMGDDILDGDKWLNVRIRINNASGVEIGSANSMAGLVTSADAALNGKTLSSLMFAGALNPSQLQIAREILDLTAIQKQGDMDVAVFADVQAAYTITRNANGTISVAHTDITDGLESDGVDTLRNIEVLRFADGDVVLSPPSLQLHAFDGTTYLEQFGSDSYTANDGAWTEDWTESDNNSSTTGDIEIEGAELSFDESIDGGELISRAVDLTGVASATLSFTYEDDNLGAGENLIVEAFDGADWQSLGSLGEDTPNGAGTFSAALTAAQIGAHSAIRFRADGNWDGGENFYIDNVSIAFTRPAVTPTIDHETTFTEGGAAVSVANNPGITDGDDTELVSATIVLTNAQTGDSLAVAGTLPAGISATTVLAAGQITINLTGPASLAAYQAAIQAVVFSNPSDTPVTVDRIVQVSVSDGLLQSNVATTIINVASVDDPVNANNDTIITNALGTAFAVPEWVLLANDTDADNTIDVTAVGGQAGLTAVLNVDSVTVTDTGAPNGSFTYTATGGTATDTATVNVNTVTGTTTLSETFGSTSYTDSDGTWTQDWVETGDQGDGNTSPTAGAGIDNGQIRIVGGASDRLEFDGGNNAGNSDGAVIQRALTPPAGALSATISYEFGENLDAGETVLVQFSRDGTNLETVQTIGSTSNNGSIDNLVLTGPFTAGAFLRFTASAMNTDADVAFIDDISIAFSTPVNAVNGGGGNEILVGDVNGSSFNGGGGNDTILAGDGNDTITQVATSGGRDFVDGGAGSDSFVVTGDNSVETYRVYSRVAALAAGITGLNAATEIVITRNGTTNAQVIAELDNIENITINTAGGADTVTAIGDFNPTSLAFTTIHVEGGAGDDTVDITSLLSEHSIHFKTNGGNDKIVGALRPQDIIELPPGANPDDFEVTENDDGTTTVASGTDSVTFEGDMPEVLVGDEDDHDGDEDDHEDDHDDEDEEEDDCDTDEDDDDGAPAPSGTGHLIGTPQDDVLIGTSAGDLMFGYAGVDYIVTGAGADIVRAGAGDDLVNGEAGRDMIFGEAGDDDLLGGDDDDMMDGGIGDDRMFGQNGNDLLEGGAGDDSVFGGNGNDMIVAALNDGNDTYYGGDISEDAGSDTLDMGFLSVDIDVDLGTGVGGRGSAISSQSGTDVLWGVENVVTGSGADTITMSNAVNIVDGGQGEDVFVFGSAAAAHGDTIRGFEAGDKIDLSGIDANGGVAGNDTFTLESGQSTTAPGQIVVTHETREDGEYTVISGDTAGTNAPEFRISIAGNHTLNADNFNL